MSVPIPIPTFLPSFCFLLSFSRLTFSCCVLLYYLLFGTYFVVRLWASQPQWRCSFSVNFLSAIFHRTFFYVRISFLSSIVATHNVKTVINNITIINLKPKNFQRKPSNLTLGTDLKSYKKECPWAQMTNQRITSYYSQGFYSPKFIRYIWIKTYLYARQH